MKRTETRQAVVRLKIPRKKPGCWNQVYNDRKQRVRKLWERNGAFYAQIRVAAKSSRFRLEHPKTVAEASLEMQVLKKKSRDGVLKPLVKVGEKAGHTLRDASAAYQEHTKALGDKDPKTRKRE
jgi:hypothetical protein